MAIASPEMASAWVSTLLDAYATGGTSPLSLPTGSGASGALMSRDLASDHQDQDRVVRLGTEQIGRVFSVSGLTCWSIQHHL